MSLISSEGMEIYTPPEVDDAQAEKQVPKPFYVFDADGVLTDDNLDMVPEILDILTKQLIAGQPIAINTGRNVAWITDHILRPIKSSLQASGNLEALQNIVAYAEMGAFQITYNEDGDEVQTIADNVVPLPDDIRAEIDELLIADPAMFVGEIKQVYHAPQIDESVVKRGSKPAEAAKKKAQILIEDMFKSRGIDDFIILDAGIALVVHHKDLGKQLGMERALKWFKETQGVDAEEVTAFGDSTSDIPMADKAHELGRKTRFVFVGEPPKIEAWLAKNGERDYEIVLPGIGLLAVATMTFFTQIDWNKEDEIE